MNPLCWLLTAPAWQSLHRGYTTARGNGASRFASALHLFWSVLGLMLLRFETPGWQRIIQQRHRLIRTFRRSGHDRWISCVI